MNTDPKKSAQPCGCDEGANHLCAECRKRRMEEATTVLPPEESRRIEKAIRALPDGFPGPTPAVTTWKFASPPRGLFPNSAQGRKDHPVFTGVLMYFPDAIAAVARVSKMGNDQHNPGQPLHWARSKSTDQTDTATRHMMDHGVGNVRDTDGMYHLAKAAWRILAELQLTIEKEREGR